MPLGALGASAPKGTGSLPTIVHGRADIVMAPCVSEREHLSVIFETANLKSLMSTDCNVWSTFYVQEFDVTLANLHLQQKILIM